jgi:hypothetical protein
MKKLFVLFIAVCSCSPGNKSVVIEPNKEYNNKIAAPVGLSAVIEGNKIDLMWDAVPTAIGYQVFRDLVFIGETHNTSYIDSNLKFKTNYNYNITSFKGDEVSAFSNSLKTQTKNPLMKDVVDSDLWRKVLPGQWGCLQADSKSRYSDSWTFIFNEESEKFTLYHIYNHYYYITDTQIDRDEYLYEIRNDSLFYKPFDKMELYGILTFLNDSTFNLNYKPRVGLPEIPVRNFKKKLL